MRSQELIAFVKNDAIQIRTFVKLTAFNGLTNTVTESSQDSGGDAFGTDWSPLEKAHVLGEDN